jgi:hypothetical protein
MQDSGKDGCWYITKGYVFNQEPIWIKSQLNTIGLLSTNCGTVYSRGLSEDERWRTVDCSLILKWYLSVIGQVSGPVHQLRDSLLAWPIRGREVASSGPSQPVEVTSGPGPHQPTSCQVQIYVLYKGSIVTLSGSDNVLLYVGYITAKS